MRLWPFAFKFGRGKYGAKCNRHEADLYARNRAKPHRRALLCPVLWRSPRGKLLVMRYAATPVTQQQIVQLKEDLWAFKQWGYIGPDDDGCPFEWKVTDWGVLRGHVVAVDYAATCLDEKTIEAMNTRAPR